MRKNFMSRHTLQLAVIAFTLVAGYSCLASAKDDSAPAKTEKTANAPQTSGAANTQSNKAQSSEAQPTSTDSDQAKVSTEALEPKKNVWPFDGMRGNLDKQAAQRGFQIYSQVCSVCHSMNLVAYRDLTQLGFSEAEVKVIASQKQVDDMDDNGAHIQRPGKPFDHFVPPYPNEKASRAANNGAYPPDLSLIVKAREHGPDYVYSLISGFKAAPANEPAVAGKYYNPYFQGHWISMPPPLRDNAVAYQDGTNASVDQMARDVVTFLEWAAEPEMQERHEMGIKVLVFLFIMAIMFYVAKKRMWKKLH
jgi:ubiquinol-cytochrome c reductase cytochrome c1 subunit